MFHPSPTWNGKMTPRSAFRIMYAGVSKTATTGGNRKRRMNRGR
jgi:hypothetical protein